MWLDFFRVAFGSASGFAPLGFLWFWLKALLLWGSGLRLRSFRVSLGLASGFAPLGFLGVWLRPCFLRATLGLACGSTSFGLLLVLLGASLL